MAKFVDIQNEVIAKYKIDLCDGTENDIPHVIVRFGFSTWTYARA